MSEIGMVPVWDCVIELPLGKWHLVAHEAGTGLRSRRFSAGKVWVVHPLSTTASSDGSIEKDGEKLQRDEKIEQQSEELINFELTKGCKPSFIRNHFA